MANGVARAVECVEDRTLLAANLHVTSVSLANVSPVYGEQGYGRIDYTTADLPVDASYDIEYKLDGVPVTLNRKSGAGLASSNWAWIYGGWILSPGNHTLEIKLDASNTVVEADETDNTGMINFSTSAPTTLPQKLLWPLAAEQASQYAVVNYVDIDPRGGVMSDFSGGPFVYDGHNASDITAANFTLMDAGIPVLAAADGTVVAVQDGNFDRETSSNNNPANFVTIDHGNGWKTIYYHLLADSVTVEIGQTILAGQVLGLMGSSGSSTDTHLHFMVLHNDYIVEPFYNVSAYFASPLPVFQGDQTPHVEDYGVTNYNVFADLKERPSSHEVFSTAETSSAWFWYRLSHLNVGDVLKIRWFRPDSTQETEYTYTAGGVERYGGHGWTLGASTWSSHLGTWHVAVSLGGTELARASFDVVGTAGIPEIRLRDAGSRLIPDGRTTPFNFGSVAKDATAPTQVYTVENHGGTILNLSSVVLPPGFSLVSSPALTVAPGGTTSFTVRMDTSVPGEKFGAVRVLSDDSDESVYDFNISGTVTGSPAAGTPNITLPGPAVRYLAALQSVPISPDALFADSDSAQFNNGSATIEFASGGQIGDTLTLLNQGNGAGEIGINGSILSYGGTVIGTYSPGSAGVPLSVLLNASANAAAIQALLRAASYSNSTVVNTSPRYVRFTVVDEAGKNSNQPVVVVVTEFGAPVVNTLSPNDDGTNVGISTNLVVTFNETVVKGTGNILIRKISDHSIVQTIDVASAAATTSGSMVTIDPADLAGSTGYYIEIPATAFRDLSNNVFAGISGATAWNFTTVNVNNAPIGTVTIDDTTPAENQLLTAANNLADNDGLGTFTYTWRRADNAAFTTNVTSVGANSATFTPGDLEVGKFLRVTVSYTDGNGTAESVSSAVTSAVSNVNDAPTGTVTINDTTPAENQLLTATNNLADNDGLGTFTYTWRRADNAAFTTNVTMVGSNSATLTPGAAEVGKFLQVTISYTDGNGTVESVSSAVTAGVTVKLPAPVITGPTPVTPYQRPTITWTSVAGADRYQIWIKNQSTSVNPFLQVTRTATAFYPSTDLGIGRFNLWIRSGSPDGQFSDYTPQYDFRIATKATFYAVERYQATATPTIAWKPLTGATKYDLWINNLSTGQLQVVRDPGLTATSWTSPTPLPMGDYRVWVRGLDASGLPADWSTAVDFLVLPPVSVIGPVNSTFDLTPTFTWNSVLGAAGYDLVLRDGNGSIVNHPTNIVGTSFTQPINLPVGSYRWQVFAVSSGEQRSPWATIQNFFVGGRPSLLTPVGNTSDTTPTFSWMPVDGAATYELFVSRVDAPVSGIINLTGLIATSHTSATPLPIGTYRAWIRAISTTAEASLWSVQVDFAIVELTELPGLSPDGSPATLLAVLADDLIQSEQVQDLFGPTPRQSAKQLPSASSDSRDRSEQQPLAISKPSRAHSDLVANHDNISRSSAVADGMSAGGVEPEPTADAMDVIMAEFTDRDFTQH